MVENFDKVVGFTSKDCTCIDEGRPVDYSETYSGYYLDEGEHGINLLMPTAHCGDGDIWDLLKRSKTSAINDFLLHFGNKLSDNKNEILNNKAVNVGKRDFTKYLSGSDYRGLRISPVVYKGATLVLSSLKVYNSATETITVTISPSIGDDQTFDIDTVKGFNEVLTTALRLPLSSAGQPIEYTIYHNSANDAINNVLYCTTCTNRKINYVGVLDIEGVEADSEIEIKESTVYRNRASGFVIDARIDCNAIEWLCNVENDYYKFNPYGRTVAKVLQMMWTVKTVSEILSSNSTNFYTTLSREHLYGKRNHLNKLLQDMIIILAAELPQDLSHCYICKPAFGFSKQSL